MTNNQDATAFKKLDASEAALESNGITEIDSLCMNCHGQGCTKLMLTRIPFYRDVIISSFSCEHCAFKNNGIDSANKIQKMGIRLKLTVTSPAELNRQLVKTDWATLRIPLVDLEIPANTQKGLLTTIEGILERVITNLKDDIELRKESDPDTSAKLAQFVEKLSDLRALKLGDFEVIVDDPSGDSFIENPDAPKKDDKLVVQHYKRTAEQNELLGIEGDSDVAEPAIPNNETDLADEIVQFHNNCPNCNALCETNMKLTDIPLFKTVIIMCTVCEACGCRTSEVKSGSGIEEKGSRFTLKITDPSDLNRDILKSEMASFEIPEIEFFMNEGTLGGKFTTLEGLLKDCREQLEQVNPFASGGDSTSSNYSDQMKKCLQKLEEIQNGQLMGVTVIIDDPTGNSYLQNVYAPDDDPNMKVEHYERSYEQNDMLGLNDMKTENYQTEDDK